MRRQIQRWAVGGSLWLAAAGWGCAEIPPCTVSPVDIEETRENVKILEQDLITARDRAAKLSAELATKQAELNAKKDKPAELKKKLKNLKKGSGRETEDDEKKDDEKETA